MKNIIIFGPPGSGKGTQAELLVKNKGLSHISTGDIFRKNIKGSTKLGVLASSYIENGQLVPDNVTSDMLSDDVYVINNGMISEQGKFKELKKDESSYLNILLKS